MLASGVLCLVAQACLILYHPIDCSPPSSPSMGILQASILEWVAMPSSRGSSQPGTKPRCPSLQADFLPSEPPGKPKNTGVGSLSLLQRFFPTRELNWGLLHCRWISGILHNDLTFGYTVFIFFIRPLY